MKREHNISHNTVEIQRGKERMGELMSECVKGNGKLIKFSNEAHFRSCLPVFSSVFECTFVCTFACWFVFYFVLHKVAYIKAFIMFWLIIFFFSFVK